MGERWTGGLWGSPQRSPLCFAILPQDRETGADLVGPNWLPVLRYGQVVKQRDERHRVIGVYKRSRYGDVPLERISTVYIERHNLTLRHENRRLTRKTIAFSKRVTELKAQMLIYQGY